MCHRADSLPPQMHPTHAIDWALQQVTPAHCRAWIEDACRGYTGDFYLRN